jgi:hypothetical protein
MEVLKVKIDFEKPSAQAANRSRGYRPLIGAIDTGRCTLNSLTIFWDKVDIVYTIVRTVIIFKNLQFILLFLNI